MVLEEAEASHHATGDSCEYVFGYASAVAVELVETAGVSRVLLEATVTDKAGRFVNGLDAAAFQVLENGEPQTIDIATFEGIVKDVEVMRALPPLAP